MKNEAERLAIVWGVPVAITTVAVAVRLLLSVERLTLLGIARGFVVGGFVGFIVYQYLEDVPGLSDGWKGIILGVSAVLAEDLVVALLVVGRRIRENPAALLALILRGRK